MKIITTKSPRCTFYVREQTLDERIVHETVDARYPYSYWRYLSFCEDDIWIDAGAHIGSFSCTIAPHVKTVFAFEPDTDNYELLIQNSLLNKRNNIFVTRGAVVGNFDRTRTFYLNQLKNTAGHSFYHQRGRVGITVQCYNINNIFSLMRPNKMKLDVEGEEEAILAHLAFEHYDMLEELAVEWHLSALRDTDAHKYHEMVDFLREKFPYVIAEPYRNQRYLAIFCNKHAWSTTNVLVPLTEFAHHEV